MAQQYLCVHCGHVTYPVPNPPGCAVCGHRNGILEPTAAQIAAVRANSHTKQTSTPPARIIWVFTERIGEPRDRWQWRKIDLDGALLDSSEECYGYGKAVAQALARGFSPSTEYWMTQSRGSNMFVGPARPDDIPRRDPPEHVKAALKKAGF